MAERIILDRNVTNFQLQLLNCLRAAEWDNKYDFLKAHQNIVRWFAENVIVMNDGTRTRGLLVFHETGVGKSLVIAAVAIDAIERGEKRKIILLISKSLHENLRDTIHKYVRLRAAIEPMYYLAMMTPSALDEWILANFEFVSMNASNMIGQLNRAVADRDIVELERKLGTIVEGSLDSCMILVDEAHNLFRMITNGSKIGLKFYEMCQGAKDLSLFFFTGTPIASDPFQIVPCFNMLSGSRTCLPEDYKDFRELFCDGDGQLKNKEKFQNRLFGLVSSISINSNYYSNLPEDARPEFPLEHDLEIVRVNMTHAQWGAYRLAAELESQEGESRFGGPYRAPVPPALTKPKSGRSSSYHVRTRMLSNFHCVDVKDPRNIPAECLESTPKFDAMLKIIDAHPNQLGLMYSQFVGIGGLGAFARYLAAHGFEEFAVGDIKNKYLEERLDSAGFPIAADGTIDEDSAKFANNNVAAANSAELEVIESDVERAGGSDLPSYVVDNDFYIDITDIHGANDAAIDQRPVGDAGRNMRKKDSGIVNETIATKRPRRFAVISGNVPVEARQEIVRRFSSDENKHGADILLLLVSATGAEGLDLKNGRYVLICEPYWNYMRILQIIARFVRTNSHLALPKAERNVQPYLFIALPPIGETINTKTNSEVVTRDMQFYSEMMADYAVIRSFTDAIKATSIESALNKEANTYICAPNNKRLFTDDIDADVSGPNPCVKYAETKFDAREIIINNKKYYYREDKDSIYDWRVFVYDAGLNVYRPLRENSDEFIGVIDAINEVAK